MEEGQSMGQKKRLFAKIFESQLIREADLCDPLKFFLSLHLVNDANFKHLRTDQLRFLAPNVVFENSVVLELGPHDLDSHHRIDKESSCLNRRNHVVKIRFCLHYLADVEKAVDCLLQRYRIRMNRNPKQKGCGPPDGHLYECKVVIVLNSFNKRRGHNFT
jgi:hypothetical protein